MTEVKFEQGGWESFLPWDITLATFSVCTDVSPRMTSPPPRKWILLSAGSISICNLRPLRLYHCFLTKRRRTRCVGDRHGRFRRSLLTKSLFIHRRSRSANAPDLHISIINIRTSRNCFIKRPFFCVSRVSTPRHLHRVEPPIAYLYFSNNIRSRNLLRKWL